MHHPKARWPSRIRDTKDLERVIRGIQATRHVFSTETDVVFSTGFERRPLPLGDATAHGLETGAAMEPYR